jgi:hypothetical protein
MAAVLAGGPGAALRRRSAGALWDIRPAPGLPEVATPRRLQRSRIEFHCCRVPEDEMTIKDGIPVTTVSRTLFDLAAVLSPGQLARAVNEAEIRRLWDRLSLQDLLDRHPRRPGAAKVRALIADPGGAGTRNDFEDAFLAFLDRFGLSRPATNVPVHLGDRTVEVDFAWVVERLIVELDGRETHGTRAAFESDRARDRALTARGWRVIRITWRQLHDDPHSIARDLRSFLAG